MHGPAASDSHDRAIVTAASEAYGPSLIALLGSLDLNWPGHPPVLVYDIGLDQPILRFLAARGIPVKRVPPFCPHWRQHFTWKLWCLSDAPAHDVLWMDAGLVVLQPADEMFDAIDRLGYFFTTNHELLDWEASPQACRGCGVPPEFRLGKLTLPGTLMGFRKAGNTLRLLDEALVVAQVEEHIAATEVTHRHDQAILSLLAYKHLGRVQIADGRIYLGKLSPREIPGQRIWVHRRRILRSDVLHFAAHLGREGPPHRPTPPCTLARAIALAELYRVYWYFGRGDAVEASARLRAALVADPEVKDDPPRLADRLSRYGARLQTFTGDPLTPWRFLDWSIAELAGLGETRLAVSIKTALEGQGLGRAQNV